MGRHYGTESGSYVSGWPCNTPFAVSLTPPVVLVLSLVAIPSSHLSWPLKVMSTQTHNYHQIVLRRKLLDRNPVWEISHDTDAWEKQKKKRSFFPKRQYFVHSLKLHKATRVGKIIEKREVSKVAEKERKKEDCHLLQIMIFFSFFFFPSPKSLLRSKWGANILCNRPTCSSWFMSRNSSWNSSKLPNCCIIHHQLYKLNKEHILQQFAHMTNGFSILSIQREFG